MWHCSCHIWNDRIWTREGSKGGDPNLKMHRDSDFSQCSHPLCIPPFICSACLFCCQLNHNLGNKSHCVEKIPETSNWDSIWKQFAALINEVRIRVFFSLTRIPLDLMLEPVDLPFNSEELEVMAHTHLQMTSQIQELRLYSMLSVAATHT